MTGIDRLKCEGHRLTGRDCTNETVARREYITVKDIDSVEGYKTQLMPLVKRAPICESCAAHGLQHWPFEFFVAFFDAPTECTHPNAWPVPKVGAIVSSGCADCGAVFRLGNGTPLGSFQAFDE